LMQIMFFWLSSKPAAEVTRLDPPGKDRRHSAPPATPCNQAIRSGESAAEGTVIMASRPLAALQMINLTIQQAWLVLAGANGMRLSDRFTRLTPSVLIFVFYAGSFALNNLVVRVLGLGVVYAVWSGVGTVLTALIGDLYFKEPATALKLVSAGLIVIGVMGLHTASHTTGCPGHEPGEASQRKFHPALRTARAWLRCQRRTDDATAPADHRPAESSTRPIGARRGLWHRFEFRTLARSRRC